MATAIQRQHLAALMRWFIAREPKCLYRQHRPMVTAGLSEQDIENILSDPKGVLSFDCSEGVTLLCRLAGLRTPNGSSYASGTGYTGTLLEHLDHYSDPKAAGVGALVVYGPGAGDHVSMVLEPGADPLLWSHGSNGGPLAIRLSAQRKLHRGPVTFLSIAKL